jgi:hypothetical protein
MAFNKMGSGICAKLLKTCDSPLSSSSRQPPIDQTKISLSSDFIMIIYCTVFGPEFLRMSRNGG